MMGKRKFKWYVLPTIYTFTIIAMVIGIGFIIKSLNNNYSNYLFSTKTITDSTIPVVITEGEEGIIKPYMDEDVSISKSYYDMNSDEQTQQNSLIYYEKTYMENTGVLYTSDNEFDVISVLDGTVKDIKNDELLGTVVEVTHSNELVTVY